MQNIDYNLTHPLRVAARPGATLDEFNVYYLAYKKNYGLVKVKLSAQDMKQPPEFVKAFAEIKALQFLMAEMEIFSEGRGSDGVVITTTTRATKEIMQVAALPTAMQRALLEEAKELKYIKGTKLPRNTYLSLVRFMPAIIARFLKATYIVSDDIKWINPVVPDTKVHHLTKNHTVMQRVDIDRIGKVSISSHAFIRFRQRSTSNSFEVTWNALLRSLREPSLKLTPSSDPEMDSYLLEKHGQVGRRYYDSKSHWHFIIVEDEGELVLVTCYQEIYKP